MQSGEVCFDSAMLRRALAWTLQSACQARVACMALAAEYEAGGCAGGRGLLDTQKSAWSAAGTLQNACQAAAALMFGVAVYLPKKFLPDIWWSGEAQMGEVCLDVMKSAWR